MSEGDGNSFFPVCVCLSFIQLCRNSSHIGKLWTCFYKSIVWNSVLWFCCWFVTLWRHGLVCVFLNWAAWVRGKVNVFSVSIGFILPCMSFCRVISKKPTLSDHAEARNHGSPTKELIAKAASREEPEGMPLSCTKVHSQKAWPAVMRPSLPADALISRTAIQDSSLELFSLKAYTFLIYYFYRQWTAFGQKYSWTYDVSSVRYAIIKPTNISVQSWWALQAKEVKEQPRKTEGARRGSGLTCLQYTGLEWYCSLPVLSELFPLLLCRLEMGSSNCFGSARVVSLQNFSQHAISWERGGGALGLA